VVAAALRSVLAHGVVGEVYNCAGTKKTVLQVAQDMCTLVRMEADSPSTIRIKVRQHGGQLLVFSMALWVSLSTSLTTSSSKNGLGR
jgi:hypothetical protein